MNTTCHSIFNKCFDLRGTLEYEGGTVKEKKKRNSSTQQLLVVRSQAALNKKLEGKV